MFTDSSFWFQMSRGRDISCLSVDATVRQYTISSWRNERIDLPRPRSILTPSSCPVFDGSGRFPRSTSLFISIHSSFSWTSFFFKVYTEANTWDCIATCFFIDCANNIVSFIETIFKILKSGSLSSNHVELAPSINDSFIFDRWRLDQFGPIALSLFGHPGWEFNRTHLRNGQWLQYITFQFHSTHTLLIDQRNCARIRVRHRSNVLPCWL